MTCRQAFNMVHTLSGVSANVPGFTLWSKFLTRSEQWTLLAASLHKLDSMGPRKGRRLRQEHFKTKFNGSPPEMGEGSLQNLFAPDGLYEFQEGHFDGVIRHYREMHLTSWPVDTFDGLEAILSRLSSLCPSRATQTHLLHLASYGDIYPHTDNIGASGSWILGVSLGDERLLKMEKEGDFFSVELPSGSVYLQRDSVRYQYKHSILRKNIHQRDPSISGQRMSIMIRVCALEFF
ncbi:uncharacterized protein LACBIDRAFT_316029 [Laccaria bicolor S238N-H82]|uniref:Predicted protein n=1 Tax=Laccaria bicolor (strain S238N-H82 / ATCC MYA-4686) TaxID=486041 RepID=B0D3R9_LACBS|nr:uncharacterized protein LACBIDRAFT_316029 [Laccaria bicolor S238N-H82]EDR11316.1 predicted protein [Laccaria bicolor S238N-H82]|eukprot:XP_001878617.1 predicted protein [Laccaria bicolor S238N-H82]